jgi:hypothetical protein
MRVKSAQLGEGGGRTPSPFYYIYHHEQSYGVRSNLDGRYTPPLSPLPLYVLCGIGSHGRKSRDSLSICHKLVATIFLLDHYGESYDCSAKS